MTTVRRWEEEETAHAVSPGKVSSCRELAGEHSHFHNQQQLSEGERRVILDPASSTSRLQAGWESSRVLPAQPSGPAARKTCVIFQRTEPALTRWEIYECLTLKISLIKVPLSQMRSFPSLTLGCQAPAFSLGQSRAAPPVLCSLCRRTRWARGERSCSLVRPSFLGQHGKVNGVCSARVCHSPTPSFPLPDAMTTSPFSQTSLQAEPTFTAAMKFLFSLTPASP